MRKTSGSGLWSRRNEVPTPPAAWSDPLISIAIDTEATASLVVQRDAEIETAICHACDAPLVGEPGGRGLFMWVRGDEVRFEEPTLCDRCAVAIGIKALSSWAVEEEEG